MKRLIYGLGSIAVFGIGLSFLMWSMRFLFSFHRPGLKGIIIERPDIFCVGIIILIISVGLFVKYLGFFL